MTSDPTATDQLPLNQGPTENQTDELPDNGLSDGGGGQVNSVDVGAFTERGDNAETAAFEQDGEYSGGEFAGGDIERSG
ncbi:MAG: hypothetical protein ABWZ98_12075 [Nakamurella sp.]